MSLLLYLAWAVTQLESVLALEIQSQATQVQYQSEFERAEALLAQCEDQLRTLLIHELDSSQDFDALGSEGCRLKLMSRTQMVHQQKHPIKNTLLIELEVGQGIRLRSALRYQIASQHLSRINWQPIYE
ncbi:hypothetical protein [Polynucleobacter acidiphobus]|uniref:hypothetical protein n=1 Tax=Polynucleobacter acidiphobus TaxID=556053 RepID=UPI000D3C50AA|nr:hypothetical protein [Polynucleobacter acidiphobus]